MNSNFSAFGEVLHCGSLCPDFHHDTFSPVNGLDRSEKYVQVSSGQYWCAALSESGNMYTWGDIMSSISQGNYFGHKNTQRRLNVNPGTVHLLEKQVVHIGTGWIHAAAVTGNLRDLRNISRLSRMI